MPMNCPQKVHGKRILWGNVNRFVCLIHVCIYVHISFVTGMVTSLRKNVTLNLCSHLEIFLVVSAETEHIRNLWLNSYRTEKRTNLHLVHVLGARNSSLDSHVGGSWPAPALVWAEEMSLERISKWIGNKKKMITCIQIWIHQNVFRISLFSFRLTMNLSVGRNGYKWIHTSWASLVLKSQTWSAPKSITFWVLTWRP